jgi:hypothetical protein
MGARPLSSCFFALLILSPALALGQTQVSDSVAPARVESHDDDQILDARYWMWGESRDTPGFDGDGTNNDTALYQRLNLDLTVEYGALGGRVDVDLVTGRLAGDVFSVENDDLPAEVALGTRPRGEAFGDAENILDPRNAYLSYRSPVGELRLGLQTSNFGLGLLANDGEPEDWDLFNQPYGGDRGFRALFATKPLAPFATSHTLNNIYLAVGGDVVYRDDIGAYINGDRATQFITSIFYQGENPNNPRESTFVGAYMAARTQEDGDGDQLDVLAFDMAARQRWYAGDWHLDVGAEAALFVGDTDRAYSFNGEPITNVLGWGAAAEASARWIPMRLAFDLLAGFAQGDANADDDTLYRFRFDPNYKVGLVLFDYYLPAVTRQSYTRATNPEQSGLPPKGIEGLISDGAVENAIYVHPRVYFGNPEGLLTGIGFLWAVADEPVFDPYSTFEQGGRRIGINGAEASTDLGFEVNAAARYRYPIWQQLRLEAKVEYGVFFPGAAFDDASGAPADPQNLLRGRVGIIW